MRLRQLKKLAKKGSEKHGRILDRRCKRFIQRTIGTRLSQIFMIKFEHPRHIVIHGDSIIDGFYNV